ncbi:3-hydroxybenzoate 6-monooxygenase [Eoetvoesiella caeni]
MSRSEHTLLIVGGGIGGITAALSLAAQGHRIYLFEQASEFKEIGAGIQIGPNAFYLFDQLGLTNRITALAAFPDDLVVMDSISGDEVTAIPAATLIRQRFGYPYGLIHRADLHAVLRDGCGRFPNITMHSGCKVADFEDTGDRVVLTTESGQTYTGDALIGADGLWSSVRAKIVHDGPPRVSGHIAYRAVLPVEDVPQANRRNAMTLWAGPKNHLVHYPLRGGKLFNLVAVFHSDRYEEGWDSYGDTEELMLRFQGVVPEVKQMLNKIDSWRMWVLCDREPIKEWSKGRVTLLGDAAHPMLQYLAQGACMAMEDAVCLANKIQNSNGDFATAFIAYQDARYLRTARVQLTARLYGSVYHAAGATRDLRNAFLRGRTAEQFCESISWLYDKADFKQSLG